MPGVQSWTHAGFLMLILTREALQAYRSEPHTLRRTGVDGGGRDILDAAAAETRVKACSIIDGCRELWRAVAGGVLCSCRGGPVGVTGVGAWLQGLPRA